MKPTTSQKNSSLWLTLFLSSLTLFPQNQASLAQIIPDDTLGSEASIVNQINETLQHLEGGAIRGENLFHSFLEFNISEGAAAYFANPQGIINIFSRVTGNNISEIMGTLGVLGEANLFFVNPNGIMFGNGAQLDIAGSFVASSGSGFILPNGSEFSATNPQAPPLLTVTATAPVGLKFEGSEGIITNEAHLSVPAGKSITLVGNEVVNRGNLTAAGGTVKLMGNEINLEGETVIDVSAPEGGGIVLIGKGENDIPTASSISIGADVNIKTDGLLEGNGGLVEIEAEGIVEFEGSISATEGVIAGDGGKVVITSAEVINEGTVDVTAPNGEPGVVEISSNQELAVTSSSIVPDDSLGAESSEIEAIDESNDRVIGGAERGVNLFHSFLEFNIETGKGVYFANPVGIDNILARVTGDNISEIRGTLGVEGSADLYFINPNGLFFNQNASLDLNGSFFASTAEAIVFDEFEYSAVNANLPPILVEANGNEPNPTGLRFGKNPGDIILKNEARFTEQGDDAGELLDTAQSINDGNTPLPDGIQGDLTGENDADLYQVSLEADKPFTATTVGGSNVDTRLFLFDSQGLGIDANEDSEDSQGTFTFQSTLSEFTPTESGVYYLGISSHANAPESVDGEIFAFNFDTFEFEGLGVGGNSPLSSWNQDGFVDGGGYVISLSNRNETNLAVNPGQTLALIGGDVTIDGVKIISPGSNIILGGLNQGEVVNINPDLSLSFPQGIKRGDVSLINSTVLDVAGQDGGSININAQNIEIKNDSQVLAGIKEGLGFENAQAGDIRLDVRETLEVENSDILNDVNPNAVGYSGRIVVNAQDVVINGATLIATDILGKGKSGGIVIDTTSLSLTNGAQISASTFGEGDAGAVKVIAKKDITLDGESDGFPSGIFSHVNSDGMGNSGGIVIDTISLSLKDGGTISANTFGKGNAGEVKITASEGITLDGVRRSNNDFPSGIFSRVRFGGMGNSKGIVIETSTLSLTNGAQISASTEGKGNAGKVQVNASEKITLDGEASNGFPSGIFSRVNRGGLGKSEGIFMDTSTLSLTNGAQISAGTSSGGMGNSGPIVIDTTILSLKNGGLISTSTRGQGNAGEVKITAYKQVFLSGTNFIDIDTIEREIGGVLALTFTTGKAGEITINTPQLTISEGSGIEAFTRGEGKAGDINIKASESLILNSDTKLIAESRDAGIAGDINIDTPILTIGENAQLSATATEDSTSPTAGDITLNVNQLNIAGELGIFAETQSIADAGILIIQPYETNSNLNIKFTDEGFISARTTNIGDGGSITITAPETIDIRGEGSITAQTSGSGQAGSIIINTNQLNISDGVKITASTFDVGNSRNITLDAAKLNLDNATIQALTTGAGNPGRIEITNKGNNANQVTLTNSTISTEIQADGEASNPANITITINTDNLDLDASTITASTSANRDAGNITIPDAQQINLTNNSQISALTTGEGKAGNINFVVENEINIDSGSILNVETKSGGDAGDIDFTADTITIGEDAELSARTREQATGKAGNISLNANQLNISGELGIFAETEGIANAGNLTINPNSKQNLNITFTSQGQISASTSGSGEGGDIEITAPDTINLRGDGSIKVEASGSGQAGSIIIETNQLNITEGVEISASTSGAGDSDNITLDAANLNLDNATIQALTTGAGNPGRIFFTNEGNNTNNVTLTNSTISTEIQADGEATQPANIIINTDNLALDASTITASTTANRDAGNITIPDAQQINLINNSEITASTSGRGKAGSINLDVTKNINLSQNSTISSAANQGASGDGGDIKITSSNLKLNLNSQISVSSNGQPEADAGAITINVNQLNLDSNAQISASTSAGKAGIITINADELITTNGGQIRTTTSGSESAGDINLFISEETILSGANTGLFANTSKGSTGEGGNILVITPELLIEKEATIGVDSKGKGEGGNITIWADNVNLNQGFISAETTSGDGGNIQMTIANLLNLRQGSKISTTAGNEQQGGDGGNIKIFARYIFAIPEENSDITANAFTGKGGNITITTKAIFGIEPRDELTFLSDITASSELGVDGIIEINRLNVDPLEGLTNLPSTPAEVEVAQGCEAGTEGTVAFYDLGKGGLLAQPEDVLRIKKIPWNPLTIKTEQESWRFTKTNYSLFPTTTPVQINFSCQKFESELQAGPAEG